MTFTSTSSDPEGPIQSTLWDFDNDGEYDDGTGTQATWQFSKSGSNTVRLKVVDGNSRRGHDVEVRDRQQPGAHACRLHVLAALAADQ